MAITSHLIENDHYELVPSKESDDAWNIRFLKGDYVESVVSIGTIKVGEEIPGGDDHQLTFDFNVRILLTIHLLRMMRIFKSTLVKFYCIL